MAITSIYPPTSKRPHIQDLRNSGKVFNVSNVLQFGISPLSWVLIGASLQALAVYLFSNGRYVLLISTMALLVKIVNMLLQAYNITPNPLLEGVFEGRTTALIPEGETGEIITPAGKKIAILHLGAVCNSPFGLFHSQFAGVGKWFEKMCKVCDSGEVNGFLGQTTFHRQTEKGAYEFVAISYWESIEDLWSFAHSGLHRKAWQWWEETIKENNAVGINHEIFEADAHNWENIYVNFQPTMMGATTYLKRGGKTLEGGVVPDEWVSPLVDARRGKLAKSSGRMGREFTKHDETRVAKETYA